MALYLPLLLPCLGVISNNSNVDDHVVLEVLVSRNECVPTIVLEADAVCGTFIEAVEVLDSSHN